MAIRMEIRMVVIEVVVDIILNEETTIVVVIEEIEEKTVGAEVAITIEDPVTVMKAEENNGWEEKDVMDKKDIRVKFANMAKIAEIRTWADAIVNITEVKILFKR